MDSNDQDDIVKKVKSAGNDIDGHEDNQDNSSDDNDGGSDGDSISNDFGGDIGGGDQGSSEGGLSEETNLFVEPKRNNMFQPGSNDKLKETLGFIGVNEELKVIKKSSIFVKNNIKLKLKETFNQEDMNDSIAEPMVKPTTKPNTAPTTKPNRAPSRRNKPFLPMPTVQPDPKAIK